jgi:hypothetical protein
LLHYPMPNGPHCTKGPAASQVTNFSMTER